MEKYPKSAVDKCNAIFFVGIIAWLLGTPVVGYLSPLFGVLWMIGIPIYWFFAPDYISNYIYRTEREKEGIKADAEMKRLEQERRRCPKCKSLQTTVAGRKSRSYETTETRYRRIDHYSREDEFTGYSEVEYEAPVMRKIAYQQLTCAGCSHAWEVQV
ncbi:MAG: hypothetical protein C0504_18170 [Candidatus Solibacter sp.]|nr:hypothetical protein [Candidatus Solibacter sp.]